MHPFNQRKRSTRVRLHHCKSGKTISQSESPQGARTLTPKLASPRSRHLRCGCYTNPTNLTRSQHTTTLYPFRLNIVSHKNESRQLSCPENPQGKFRHRSKRETHQEDCYGLWPWAWHSCQRIPRPLWWQVHTYVFGRIHHRVRAGSKTSFFRGLPEHSATICTSSQERTRRTSRPGHHWENYPCYTMAPSNSRRPKEGHERHSFVCGFHKDQQVCQEACQPSTYTLGSGS